MNYAVELEGVSVTLSGVRVLEDITLKIPRGEFWGIIGPNGGGKTTLLRTVIGTVKPLSGAVRVFGMSPKDAVKEGLIGYLPQRLKGKVPFSAFDLISLIGDSSRAEEALEKVGMLHKADVPYHRLSGGEQQRVLIAAILSREPKLLLLDEPSTGVDVVAQDSFYNMLKKLKSDGVTIVMVSHDIGVVAQFVDNVVCLNRRLKYTGDPRGALNCHLLEELYGDKVSVFVHHPECEGCHIYQRYS